MHHFTKSFSNVEIPEQSRPQPFPNVQQQVLRVTSWERGSEQMPFLIKIMKKKQHFYPKITYDILDKCTCLSFMTYYIPAIVITCFLSSI